MSSCGVENSMHKINIQSDMKGMKMTTFFAVIKSGSERYTVKVKRKKEK